MYKFKFKLRDIVRIKEEGIQDMWLGNSKLRYLRKEWKDSYYFEGIEDHFDNLLWEVVGFDCINGRNNIYLFVKDKFIRKAMTIKIDIAYEKYLVLQERVTSPRARLCQVCPLKDDNLCPRCEESSLRVDPSQFYPGDTVLAEKYKVLMVHGVYNFRYLDFQKTGRLGLWGDGYSKRLEESMARKGEVMVLARPKDSKFSLSLHCYLDDFYSPSKLLLKGSIFRKYFLDPRFSDMIDICSFCPLPKTKCKECKVKEIKL